MSHACVFDLNFHRGGAIAYSALDDGDPMYNSGPEEDENYVLVSEGDGTTGAPRAPQYCPEHATTLIGPKYTLAEFKRRVVEALDELGFLSADFQALCSESVF